MDLGDTRKWIERYEKADYKNKAYEFLIKTLSCDIPDGFVYETELDTCIYDEMSKLKREKQFDKLLDLHKHKFKSSYYLDFYCIDYYLFMGDIGGIKRHLNSFLNDPVKTIDIFIPIYDKIVYYGYRDLSITICKEIINKVKDAPGLISGVEEDFTKTAIADKLQDVFSDVKNNVSINNSDILEYLKKYDYTLIETYIDLMKSFWADDAPKFLDFQEYIDDASFFEWKLMILFFDYMAGKNVTFAAAYDIWYLTTRCFKRSLLSKKSSKSFENIFAIDKEKYNSDISK
jgi:hypothetical protein